MVQVLLLIVVLFIICQSFKIIPDQYQAKPNRVSMYPRNVYNFFSFSPRRRAWSRFSCLSWSSSSELQDHSLPILGQPKHSVSIYERNGNNFSFSSRKCTWSRFSCSLWSSSSSARASKSFLTHTRPT